VVLYDVASVGVELIYLGSMSLTAHGEGADVMNIGAASESSSAMGAVAMSKATGDVWQPGLFVVRLRGIVTDLLGLGDSVFPSLLSTFCLLDREEAYSSLFIASLIRRLSSVRVRTRYIWFRTSSASIYHSIYVNCCWLFCPAAR